MIFFVLVPPLLMVSPGALRPQPPPPLSTPLFYRPAILTKAADTERSKKAGTTNRVHHRGGCSDRLHIHLSPDFVRRCS